MSVRTVGRGAGRVLAIALSGVVAGGYAIVGHDPVWRALLGLAAVLAVLALVDSVRTLARRARTPTEASAVGGCPGGDGCTAVRMPPMGEGVRSAEVIRWCRSVGEPVREGEPLAEVSTDKVDTEVPAPCGGYLHAVYVAPGTDVAVGAPIAAIGPARKAAA